MIVALGNLRRKLKRYADGYSVYYTYGDDGKLTPKMG